MTIDISMHRDALRATINATRTPTRSATQALSHAVFRALLHVSYGGEESIPQAANMIAKSFTRPTNSKKVANGDIGFLGRNFPSAFSIRMGAYKDLPQDLQGVIITLFDIVRTQYWRE